MRNFGSNPQIKHSPPGEVEVELQGLYGSEWSRRAFVRTSEIQWLGQHFLASKILPEAIQHLLLPAALEDIRKVDDLFLSFRS